MIKASYAAGNSTSPALKKRNPKRIEPQMRLWFQKYYEVYPLLRQGRL